MLWFFAIDEAQYGPNNFISQALESNKEAMDIYLRVLSTPIVASACPNMFAVFIELICQILTTGTSESTQDFLNKILKFTGLQIENIYTMLGTRDLDSLDDIDGKLKSSDKIVLSELCSD